jgi:hypothetical protein
MKELIEEIENYIEKLNAELTRITEELERLRIIKSEPEVKKAGKAWRAYLRDKYFAVRGDGMIDHLSDLHYNLDNIKYDFGNYFRTEQEAEAHKRHLLAVGAWNRIANEYPSGCYSIAADGYWYGGTAEWSILRHIDTENNCKDAIMRFKIEGKENGFTVDDLFLYANEVRHA